MKLFSFNITNPIHLCWDPPLTNTDGTPVGHIPFYRVYGQKNFFTNNFLLETTNTDCFLYFDSYGIWYLAVTAISTNNLESDYSEILRLKLNNIIILFSSEDYYMPFDGSNMCYRFRFTSELEDVIEIQRTYDLMAGDWVSILFGSCITGTNVFYIDCLYTNSIFYRLKSTN